MFINRTENVDESVPLTSSSADCFLVRCCYRIVLIADLVADVAVSFRINNFQTFVGQKTYKDGVRPALQAHEHLHRDTPVLEIGSIFKLPNSRCSVRRGAHFFMQLILRLTYYDCNWTSESNYCTNSFQKY